MPAFDQYGQPETAKNIPIIEFTAEAIHDEAASKLKGRPIYRDVEMVKIQFPADRQRSLIRPAHAEWKKIKGQKVTYADRFPEQYKRFKADEPQVVEGTPLKEAPFLTAAQRASLKALQVYTVEQLASLDGQPLKNIGAGGRGMQQAALAYLDNARGSADVTRLADENEKLRATLRDLQAQSTAPVERSKFDDMSDSSLKDFIKEKSGAAPRGNPSRTTLVRMAREVDVPVEAEAA